MRPVAPLLLLVALAAPAAGRPPEVPDFVRMDELDMKLLNLESRFRQEEEFAKKPRQEKMILLFMGGTPKFEGKTLTGEWMVKEVLEKWDVWKLPAEQTPQEARDVLVKLPHALKERYAKVVPIPKTARHKASLPLVKALTHKNFYVREAAIESLKAIYGRTLLYKPDATPGARKAKQAKWRKEIDSLKKR
ncbi:MAG: hypothetical protein ACYSUN_15745 [Planctomycetota bacterium]